MAFDGKRGFGPVLESWLHDVAEPEDGDLGGWAAAELEKSRRYKAGVLGLLASGESPVRGSSPLKASPAEFAEAARIRASNEEALAVQRALEVRDTLAAAEAAR